MLAVIRASRWPSPSATLLAVTSRRRRPFPVSTLPLWLATTSWVGITTDRRVRSGPPPPLALHWLVNASTQEEQLDPDASSFTVLGRSTSSRLAFRSASLRSAVRPCRTSRTLVEREDPSRTLTSTETTLDRGECLPSFSRLPYRVSDLSVACLLASSIIEYPSVPDAEDAAKRLEGLQIRYVSFLLVTCCRP